MLRLSPKETKPEELPSQVGSLVLSNETVASIDFDLEIEETTLKIVINGIYLGKTEEAPFEGTKKKWKLT